MSGYTQHKYPASLLQCGDNVNIKPWGKSNMTLDGCKSLCDSDSSCKGFSIGPGLNANRTYTPGCTFYGNRIPLSGVPEQKGGNVLFAPNHYRDLNELVDHNTVGKKITYIKKSANLPKVTTQNTKRVYRFPNRRFDPNSHLYNRNDMNWVQDDLKKLCRISSKPLPAPAPVPAPAPAPVPAPAPPPPPVCQTKSYTNKPWAHQHCGAWGKKPDGWTFLFEEGLHNVPTGRLDMSSISLPKGWDLTLYSQPNGQGREKKFIGPIYCPCFLKLDWDGSSGSNINDKVRSYYLDTSGGSDGFSSLKSSTTPPPLDDTPLVTLPPEEPESTGLSKQTMIWIAVAVLVCFLVMGGSSFMMMMM